MRRTVVASLVAVPETSGSALYGMVDVLSAVGSLWGELMRRPAAEAGTRLDIRIVAPTPEPFLCGNGIPVAPYMAVDACPATDIVILPELWIGPDEPMRGRHPSVMDWIRRMYARGAALYSACSGSVMLAETGLVDHCQVTSHWAYRELFQAHYPAVRFLPEPTLTCADPAGRIVTAGGTTSWHDLAIHIIPYIAFSDEPGLGIVHGSMSASIHAYEIPVRRIGRVIGIVGCVGASPLVGHGIGLSLYDECITRYHIVGSANECFPRITYAIKGEPVVIAFGRNVDIKGVTGAVVSELQREVCGGNIISVAIQVNTHLPVSRALGYGAGNPNGCLIGG